MGVYKFISEASLILIAMGIDMTNCENGCPIVAGLGKPWLRLKSENEISLTLSKLEFQFARGFSCYARAVSLLKGREEEGKEYKGRKEAHLQLA
jgi:hypothetical protein